MNRNSLRRCLSRLCWVLPLALAGAAVLASVGWHLWVNHDRGARALHAEASPCRRTDPEPGLIHLSLQGEGYALGLAEGIALKPEIRRLVPLLMKDVLRSGPMGLVQRNALLAKAWKLDAFMPQRFREELRGMSDATGVSYADLLLVNTYDDLQYLAGCSSAVALGHGSAPLLHGRNADYGIPRLAHTKVLFDIETRGARFRIIGFPGYIGVITGMSSRGIGLSGHTSISDRMQPGVPIGILYRQLLEESRSLEEVKALLARTTRTTGNNLAVSDGRRNQAMVLEFDAGEVTQRDPVRDRLFVTNHYWTPGLRGHQSWKKWIAGSNSQRRLYTLEEFLAPEASADPARVQAALSRAADETYQSAVMEPLTGRLWLAMGRTLPVTEGGYREFGAVW